MGTRCGNFYFGFRWEFDVRRSGLLITPAHPEALSPLRLLLIAPIGLVFSLGRRLFGMFLTDGGSCLVGTASPARVFGNPRPGRSRLL